MPKTRRIDTMVKKKFVKNLIEKNNNRTEAYLATFPEKSRNRKVAQKDGCLLFQDPEVQEIYKNAGIDTSHLAKRTRELMDSENEQVASQHVKQFNAALLNKGGVQEVRKVNVNLFGDLNDAKVQRIEKGRIIEGEAEEAS